MSEWFMLAGISRIGLISFPEINNFKICNAIIEGPTLKSYIIVLFICIFVQVG